MQLRFRLLLAAFILLSVVSVRPQTTPPQSVALESGKPIERAIAGGESHTYQISLAAGQFMHVVVEQRGMDVKLSLAGADGKPLIASDLTGIIGFADSLAYEAAAAGTYQLVIRANGAATVSGDYSAKLEVKDSASIQDRKRITAESLLNEARRLYSEGRYEDPQLGEKLGQALVSFRELDDRYLQGLTLNLIGLTRSVNGQYEMAIEAYKQALPLWRSEKLRSGEGALLSKIGYSNMFLGKFEDSIEYFEQALVAVREVGDRKIEAIVLRDDLAAVYRMMNRMDKAIEYDQQALDLARAEKDRVGERMSLNQIGIVYMESGNYDRAIQSHEQSLAIAREMKDLDSERRSLINLGSVYAEMDRNEKAIEYYEQALSLAREKKMRSSESYPLLGLSNVEVKRGNFEKAIKYLEQALAVTREVKDRRQESTILISLSNCYQRMGLIDKAVEYSKMDLAIWRELGYPPGIGMALIRLAVLERKRDPATARVYVEETQKIWEDLRRSLVTTQSRTQHAANVLNTSKLYTELLLRQNQAEPGKGLDALAFETSEFQRARSLLDLLAEAGADIRQGVDAALLGRERTLVEQLSEKARLLTRAKPEEAESLKKEIVQLETDLERAQAAIRKASPNYAALTQPQPVKLSEIQAELDKDTVLLEYTLGAEGQDQSYLWAVTPNSLTTYELPKGQDIEKSARELYELLTARSTHKKGETEPQRLDRISQAEAKLPASALELSKMILGPAAALLGKKRLVIVADGALQYIPFAMLPDPAFPSNQPLIVGHEVVSLPSASTLALQRTEFAGRTMAPKTLAVIADPVFDRSDDRFKTPAPDAAVNETPKKANAADMRTLEHLADDSDDDRGKRVIRRLPFTRPEADRLMALSSKNTSFRAIDFDANRSNVLNSGLGQYRYIHFATHGLLDTDRPGLSALVLSTIDADGKPRDGFLRANDIYNMKLSAELVVLSACQTGLGKEVKGEGLIGLTRGFMYAGAKRVVVSLWSVNDKATSDLMTMFYRGMLKNNERPAAALRAAQIEMWKQNKWKSPYYWAAFTMQGEWC